MSETGSPFALPFAPAEPGFEYENVLPLKLQIDPKTGQRAAGTRPSLAVPGMVRDAVNALAMTVQGPRAVARGQVSAQDIPKLASTMSGTLLGLGATGLGRVPAGDVAASFRGWHGTPYEFQPVEGNPFGKFENKAIGSGEGAQVYGWGHYVAGNRTVAEEYQKNLAAGQAVTLNGKKIPAADYQITGGESHDPAHTAAQVFGNNQGDVNSAIQDLQDRQRQLDIAIDNGMQPDVKRAQKEIEHYELAQEFLAKNRKNLAMAADSGSLYHVEIRPDESELLDWDKRLDQQSPAVQEAMRPLLHATGFTANTLIGEQAYKVLGQHMLADGEEYQPRVSELLHNAGVPGIKYLDQFSRNKKPYSAIAFLPGEYLPVATADFGDEASANAWTEQHRIKGNMANSYRNNSPPPTSNYVIFHPDNLKIVGRNGVEAPHQLERVDHDPFASGGVGSHE